MSPLAPTTPPPIGNARTTDGGRAIAVLKLVLGEVAAALAESSPVLKGSTIKAIEAVEAAEAFSNEQTLLALQALPLVQSEIKAGGGLG